MKITLALLAAATLAAQDGFVLVKGGPVRGGAHRVDSFEILDHPITNAEYKEFVDATGYKPPPHWVRGKGEDQLPVTFVNRWDAQAYLRWRSAKEDRIYRLPTQLEFELAARGGADNGAKYPWGDEPPAGKANYDADGTRTLGAWRRHVQPVKSYAPNALGLYDMAGNVWQMVNVNTDLETNRFVYRVTDPVERESSIAGGSWARGEYYLRCGVFGGAGPGIRHPDIGFRPVRAPLGAQHFRELPRGLVALPVAGGVFLSWQFFEKPETGYHLYRATRRDAAGERITQTPVTRSTTFTDLNPPPGRRLYYRVRSVADRGEGPPSEWAGIEPGAAPTSLVMQVEPAMKQGGFTPVFGDLNGDMRLDVVLRLDNGIKEMSRDAGVPVELEAFTHYGRSLWRRPLVSHAKCYGNANNVPVVVWDMDGDGKAEVIAAVEEAGVLHLAILDGMTGDVKRKTPWTPMATDFAKSSTRVHAAIAYLNGRMPAIVTQTGLYENEIFDAYDAELKKIWQYRSDAETSGSGSHHIDIADVDGDGRDEVFNGTTLLNYDGTMRWSIYRMHPDIVAIKHILPGSKERQVFFAVETSTHAGAYLVEARTGRMLWKVNREDDPRWTHAHTGWVADIWDGSPGMEMLTNRDGHEAKDLVLFAADGKVLMNPFPQGWRPVNWTGANTRELLSSDGKRLGRFDGKFVVAIPGAPNEGSGNCQMVADLVGDYRDEVVCTGTTREGRPALFVYTNTEPAPRREVLRQANREYRLWLARNLGGGYGSYFEWEP
ncbi:MAG: SUMF1/EgtB/PvdO family nonheme iron enzyme [Bryobacteraceae bacterium]|nr:SUMF1/EgtB/PvdO family nonheme iron enzyme [Bryobacteraceae bacterium]